ncbi:MAG: SDR family NAD(P)-dependent oxidoreductase [Kordiimonadaceae bacterium]|nr:SDR family NAD(P)-dependent oxidoreductase [Kordiimonadaceae bacterium]
MTRLALVTGGNRGLGLEIAKGLAAQEYKVLLGCRNLEQGNQAASNIAGDVEAVHLDLSNSNILRNQIKEILSTYPKIDVLINNAAILIRDEIFDIDEEDFYATMQINLNAAFDLIQLITPTMIKQNYGRIVNITSDFGSFKDGLLGPVSYSVSKAALNALTMNVARTLPDTVKINSVHPGWLKTDMGGLDAPLSIIEGAETPIWLATLEDDGPTGLFFHQKELKQW